MRLRSEDMRDSGAGRNVNQLHVMQIAKQLKELRFTQPRQRFAIGNDFATSDCKRDVGFALEFERDQRIQQRAAVRQ